jgi:hypothetical protein
VRLSCLKHKPCELLPALACCSCWRVAAESSKRVRFQSLQGLARTLLTWPSGCCRALQAVVRSADGCMWEKGDNRRARMQGGTTLVLQHDFRR